ncbi:MAG TPA: hypothetical protein VJW51_11065 [Candidatus Acidoferrales bacterium]|nr:hypothetical protein [Candidatus Acidoferrales bacterium]
MSMGWSGTRYPNRVYLVASLISALLAAAIFAEAARAAENVERLREQFHQGQDPVQRAKLFPKLGAALLDEMKKLEAAKQYEQVLPLFLEYRDSAAAAFSGLTATGVDPEKHSAGFRELEMYLRRSLHQVNDVVFGMPLEDREPLRKAQQEIEDLDNRLVKALFPRGSQARKTPPSAAEPHPQR